MGGKQGSALWPHCQGALLVYSGSVAVPSSAPPSYPQEGTLEQV